MKSYFTCDLFCLYLNDTNCNMCPLKKLAEELLKLYSILKVAVLGRGVKTCFQFSKDSSKNQVKLEVRAPHLIHQIV